MVKLRSRLKKSTAPLPLSAKFAELVALHQRQALSIAMNHTNNLVDAKAIVLNAYALAFRRLSPHSTEREFARDFYPILIRCCHQYGQGIWSRIGRRKPPQEEWGTVVDESGSDEAIDTLLQQRIFNAVRKLPKIQRSTFVLRFYEDMAISDISKMLDLPQTKTKKKLSHALRKLRDGRV